MYKKIITLLSVSLLITRITLSAHAAGLGVNINLAEAGGTFVDVIKENHRWVNPDTWASLSASNFDSVGWPTTDAMLIWDVRPVAEWIGEIDDPEGYRIDRSGVYAGSFVGKATIEVHGGSTLHNVVYDSVNNITTFDLELPVPHNDGYGLFAFAFKQTQRTPQGEIGTGFTELKLLRPGYPRGTQQTFIDPFINVFSSARFATIRFKDFTGTDSGDPDYPGVTEWADRKLPTDASQDRIMEIGKRSGAAWEYVIELANLVNIDPWINIPVSATPDYIEELAKMFKENLNPELNIYVESSNEVWNTAPAFQQSQYNQAQAVDLGIGEHENHGRRTIEIAQIFESVYGEGCLNSKIRVILCSHAPMLEWWVKPMLTYLESNYGTLNRYIYAISCQGYFSGGVDAGESIEKILQDCRDNINHQMSEHYSGRDKWVKKANDLGLVGGFCIYEGGPDHGGGSTVNIANRIMVERSSGMAEMLKYNFNEGFFQLGGNVAIQFTLTSGYNRYGCWGLTDDINNLDRNFKFQAARELISATSVESPITKSDGYYLFANYPNPFNSDTRIHFSIPHAQHVRLEIFNILGKKVKTLINKKIVDGRHQIAWDGTDEFGQILASGLYLYRIQTDAFSQVRRMILMK